MSFTPPRLLAVFAFAFFLIAPLSLTFVPHARAQITEDIYQRAAKFYEQKRYTKAASLLRKAAEKGEAKAQYNLGVLYDKGQGVKQDYKQAAEWYRKAAEQELAIAQMNLGGMYQRGEGVKQDDKKAVEWTRKAAEQGYANAQNNLGTRYQGGKGVRQDDRQATEWFRKAAEQGDAKAQYNLAFMYINGHDVKKNLSTAYALLLLSVKKGNKNASDIVNAIKKLLTTEEIMAGQKIAREWEQRIEANKQKNQ